MYLFWKLSYLYLYECCYEQICCRPQKYWLHWELFKKIFLFCLSGCERSLFIDRPGICLKRLEFGKINSKEIMVIQLQISTSTKYVKLCVFKF